VANKNRTRRTPTQGRSRGRRSQRESERTRTRILDRAEKLFARRGYRGVTVRELSEACGVRPFTIQHHFGSKLQLYQSVLSRWDDEVTARVREVLAQRADFPTTVERIVEALFDFFLTRRSWVALSMRATLGEGLERGISLREQSWVRFIEESVSAGRFGALQHDLGLLLISVEGILHHHILSTAHYRRLFGGDLSDRRIRERAKQHLKTAIVSLVAGRSAPPPPARRRVGDRAAQPGAAVPS
jgi:AcrR family transcriptional regulator